MTPDNPYGPFDASGGDTIKCPYCAEPDFDAAGLKSHLLSGDCEEWNATENLTRVFSSTQETSVARIPALPISADDEAIVDGLIARQREPDAVEKQALYGNLRKLYRRDVPDETLDRSKPETGVGCRHCRSTPLATERGRCEECGKYQTADGQEPV